MTAERVELRCDARPDGVEVVEPDKYGLIHCPCGCGTVMSLQAEPVGVTLRKLREAWAEQERDDS